LIESLAEEEGMEILLFSAIDFCFHPVEKQKAFVDHFSTFVTLVGKRIYSELLAKTTDNVVNYFMQSNRQSLKSVLIK
jgi:hypothetical protein